MNYPHFTMSQKNSLKIKEESYLGIKRNTSWIDSAKESVELARVSLNKEKRLPDLKIKPITTKDSIWCGSKCSSPLTDCYGK